VPDFPFFSHNIKTVKNNRRNPLTTMENGISKVYFAPPSPQGGLLKPGF
jgi:hypothetical protein